VVRSQGSLPTQGDQLGVATLPIKPSLDLLVQIVPLQTLMLASSSPA
jgi:hypothetical protein